MEINDIKQLELTLLIPSVEYRSLPDGVWKTDENMTKEEHEESSYSKYLLDIVEEMIWDKLKWCDSCNHGDLYLNWDLSKTEHSRGWIISVCQQVELWASTLPTIQAEGSPYVRNKSGNPNYNDPETVYPKFILLKLLGE